MIRTLMLLVLGFLLFSAESISAHKSPSFLGSYKITYYYLAQEKSGGNWPLYSAQCRKLIRRTSKEFYLELSREGSGKLRDGRIINFEERCDCAKPGFQGGRICYSLLESARFPWGRGALMGEDFFPLQPFQSVAVDTSRVPLGSWLYLPKLKGVVAPNGEILNGCVRAGDTGKLVQGRHLDLFSGTYEWSEKLRKTLKAKRVQVYNGVGRCDRGKAAANGN